MANVDFNSKADMYEEKGLVQKNTAEMLVKMANIWVLEDILDVGCGPGGVTARMAGMTRGSVVGLDISSAMIDEARKKYADQANLSFRVGNADDMGYQEEFDLIFSNSAFQWFTNPERSVHSCFRALRPGGRIAVQAPASDNYCPVFINALNEAVKDPMNEAFFEHFHNPFYMRERPEQYRDLFAEAGFEVTGCEFVVTKNRFTPEEVYGIFQSGAENGYLNQAHYDIAITDAYVARFREAVRHAINGMTEADGRVELLFTRVFISARKPLA